MSTMKKLQVTAQVIICSLLSPTAFASDGVLEINHTCATQLGCFSGDTVGYPITIDGTAGRSYRLTSDLIVPDAITRGIDIVTSSISIDLNGFEIVRSGCEGVTTDCTPLGIVYAAGVYAPVANHGVSVKNGSVTGMGYGVYLGGPQSVVKGLRVRWNRGSGIRVGNYSTVSDNIAYANGEAGIYANSGAVISGNTVSQNGEGGIYAGRGSTISANSAFYNGIKEIIFKSYGIKCSAGSNVQNNSARSNTGYGVFTDTGCGYRDNVITSNGDGTVRGSGVNLGGNLCETNTICP